MILWFLALLLGLLALAAHSVAGPTPEECGDGAPKGLSKRIPAPPGER